ncbi:MAG: hypothetical protein M1546_14270 [Chloroflexi bacterium]|nr:hypothetical protein [Chloroflexota bacterium]
MQGLADAFLAALTASISCAPPKEIGRNLAKLFSVGIQTSMGAARRFLRRGYGQNAKAAAFPDPAVFARGRRMTRPISPPCESRTQRPSSRRPPHTGAFSKTAEGRSGNNSLKA